MKEQIFLQVENLDWILYWFFVALLVIGVATTEFLPPRINAVVIAGMLCSCFILKTTILFNPRQQKSAEVSSSTWSD